MNQPDNTRVALIGVIVENPESVEGLNEILHEFRQYIIGRMGVPYKEKGISVISVAVDASTDVINTLCGRIGRLDGVSSKAIYSQK